MLSKFNVLLVEDNEDKRQLLQIALEMAGYNVVVATDGVEGLQAVESHQPDLIVTDVTMPRMDGYEMVRRVRANPSTRFIPVIIQTALRGEAQDVRLGAEAGALGYITDPTDLDLLLARARTLLDFKNYLDSCEEAAFTDHLTGLANRRRFERQLEREVARTRRFGRPFCLLMLDIDHFKRVNDTHGHQVGDAALRAVAQTLTETLRAGDVVARYGGEEFAIVMPNAQTEGAVLLADRIRRALKTLDVPVTVSIGIATYLGHADDASAMIEATDRAPYESTHSRRHRSMVCQDERRAVPVGGADV